VEVRRPVVPFMEEMLGSVQEVLDHGFVRDVDYMGDDSSVVQAARVSRGEGKKSPDEDRGLIRYLMRHGHTSPFEMCEIKVHVRLPIFVARQWVRHRTASINEFSGRYSVLSPDFYLPEPGAVGGQSPSIRQGRGEILDSAGADSVRAAIGSASEAAYATYQQLLGEGSAETGVARELARAVLPLNYYTEWYWKIDLHNLLHFLDLRLRPDAQLEIREYARVIARIVQGWVPVTFEAFVDYQLEAVSLSKPAVALLGRSLAGESVDWVNSGLSKSERRELEERLFPPSH
jgi:thymidylate synthase (FAD)